jgi:hypothetical protein
MPAHTPTTGRDTEVLETGVLEHGASETGAADDYLTYLDTLRDLGSQGAEVNTALLQAHTADTPAARRQALTDLHTRLRQMAATTNQVLGDWPDPDTSRP